MLSSAALQPTGDLISRVTRLNKTPGGMLFGIGLIITACFLWAVIIPGIAAYRDKVFFSSDVASQLLAKSHAASEIIKDDQSHKQALKDEPRELNIQIAALVRLAGAGLGQATSSAPLIRTLIDARDKSQQDLKDFKGRLNVVGFYADQSLIIFLLNYLSLAWLVCMMLCCKHQIFAWRTFAISLGAYVIFTWPNYLRNFEFNQYLGQFAGTGIAAIASFLLPLIQLIR
jgi:hypothetical protein